MIQRNKLFVRVVLTAAFHSINHPSKILPALMTVWRAFFTHRGEQASRTLYIRRCLRCRSCPVFHRPTRSCGAPTAKHPELGCWCFVWYKNKIKSARCWMRENCEYKSTKEFSWPTKLMRQKWSR